MFLENLEIPQPDHAAVGAVDLGCVSVAHPAEPRAGVDLARRTSLPVSFGQVVTKEWLEELLDYGFDIGVPHPQAPHKPSVRFEDRSIGYIVSELVSEGVLPANFVWNTKDDIRGPVFNWLKERFAFVAKSMLDYIHGDVVKIRRAITLSADAVEFVATSSSPLGVFWSVENPEPFWGEEGAPVMIFEAVVAVDAIDWVTTIRRNMDCLNGDYEMEISLTPGTRVQLVGLDYEGTPISNFRAQRVA